MPANIYQQTRLGVTPASRFLFAENVGTVNAAKKLCQFMNTNWNPLMEWAAIEVINGKPTKKPSSLKRRKPNKKHPAYKEE